MDYADDMLTQYFGVEYSRQLYLMVEDFEGVTYSFADNWFTYVNEDNHKDRPINYLEIGVFYDANILTVTSSYADFLPLTPGLIMMDMMNIREDNQVFILLS
jgi:hypothetical protein